MALIRMGVLFPSGPVCVAAGPLVGSVGWSAWAKSTSSHGASDWTVACVASGASARGRCLEFANVPVGSVVGAIGGCEACGSANRGGDGFGDAVMSGLVDPVFVMWLVIGCTSPCGSRRSVRPATSSRCIPESHRWLMSSKASLISLGLGSPTVLSEGGTPPVFVLGVLVQTESHMEGI